MSSLGSHSTGVDVTTVRLSVLVPLVVLYFIAVGVAYVLGERPTKAEYAARRAARHGTED